MAYITAMTGGWIAVVELRGRAGYDGQLHYARSCQDVDKLQLRQVFRDRLIEVSVHADSPHFKLLGGEPLTIDVAGEKVELAPKRDGLI